jgi:hypothetical protein
MAAHRNARLGRDARFRVSEQDREQPRRPPTARRGEGTSTTRADRVTPLLGARLPAATLVHDLAIRGAEAVVQAQRDRAERLEWAADATSRADAPWDPDVLARIDELAWGAAPGAA